MNHFLTIDAYTADELKTIVEAAQAIKAAPDQYASACAGKNLGLIFEKPSTRTRVSFQVGMQQLGGTNHYLSPREIQLGKREEIRDVARTLSRYLDCIVLRTFRHETIENFAQHATIPVINGLSDFAHPCQAVADYMTICEKCGDPKDVTVAYVGDGNNVLFSLMMLLAKLGVSLSIASPEHYSLSTGAIAAATHYGHASGADITVCATPEEAVKNADIIYTDVFVSMGEEDQRDEKLKAFDGYQINQSLLANATRTPFIMHCLPAHRGEEITDEVIESPQSIVFDQAENRMHAQKGVLHYLLTRA